MILFSGCVKPLEIIDQTQLRISLRSSRTCPTIMTEISIARGKYVTSFTTQRNGTVTAEFVITFIVEAGSPIL